VARLCEFFAPDGSIRIGASSDDAWFDLSATFPSLRDLLGEPDLAASIRGALDAAPAIDGEISFAAPLARHGRVFAIGLNYEKIYPAGKQPPIPKKPPWFSKMPGTLVAHGEDLVIPTVSPLDYEAELAAVIGVGGRHISVDDALDHVAAYSCFNDGSVRAWQRHSVNAGKNFERSGSIGPWLVTADEIDDPQDLRLTATVDGETRQDTSTSAMIFSIAEIIAYLSTAIELWPGDVIATGSPEGTGGSFDPPRFLEAGQTVEIEISQAGHTLCTLTNSAAAET